MSLFRPRGTEEFIGGIVTLVRTEGGAGRQGDSKQQQLQHEQQQQGQDSGVERSIGGHLRWRRAGVLSGIPLGRHLREPPGASAQANCRNMQSIICHIGSNSIHLLQCFMWLQQCSA